MPSKVTQKKKKEDDNENLGPKLLALLFFILLLVFSYVVMGQKKDTAKKPPRPRAEILGEETGNPISDLSTLGQKTEEAVVGTAGDIQNATGQILGAVASSTATFVVENAGESLYSQIKNLPPQQQEEIKQQICK